MFAAVGGWVKDKASDLLATGIQAGGTLAGNAVGGAGSLVESAGNSAGQTVSGSIGGVGNYINNYGEGIKRSMSADGPVSNSPPKKTAVKPAPRGAKKPVAVSKSLPSADGSRRAPGVQQRSVTVPKSPLSARPPASGKSNASQSKPAAPRTIGPGKQTHGAQKAPAVGQKKLGSNTAGASGKVMISPESRPGYKKSAVLTSSAGKHDAKDPLGIGANFGDVSKTRPARKPESTAMNRPAAARKPTAADPLALGEDIGKIGKRK